MGLLSLSLTMVLPPRKQIVGHSSRIVDVDRGLRATDHQLVPDARLEPHEAPTDKLTSEQASRVSSDLRISAIHAVSRRRTRLGQPASSTP